MLAVDPPKIAANTTLALEKPVAPAPAAAATAKNPNSNPIETGDLHSTPDILAVENIIDLATFEQIREMDDDDTNEFSRAIVMGFLEQARETFDKMELAISKRDLDQLSALGHFLKGSSATLGLITIKDQCEKIQHFGDKRDETGMIDVVSEDECLSSITDSLQNMKEEFTKVDDYFDSIYKLSQ